MDSALADKRSVCLLGLEGNHLTLSYGDSLPILVLEEKDVLLASYGIVNLTPVQLAELPSSSILHQKNTGYGIQALVKRDAIPVDISISPVTIEELFVQLVKEYH